jgi:hypothetical protein
MVKNTSGGNKSKSFARKHSNITVSELRFPHSEFEAIAVVTQVFGHGTAQVFCNDQLFVLHIRNKFKGKSKRHNLIARGSFVLIGFREWESSPINCDLLHVYDSTHVDLLRKSHFDLSSLDKVLFSDKNDHSEVIFSNVDDQIHLCDNSGESIEIMDFTQSKEFFDI